MSELYPFTHYKEPIPAEPNFLRDLGLHLGLCAIDSQAAVVSNITVPDMDIERLLTEVPEGTLVQTSSRWFDRQLRAFQPDNIRTTRRLFDSLAAVLRVEEQVHELTRVGYDVGDQDRAILYNLRAEEPVGQDIHLDADLPWRPKPLFGRRRPTTAFSPSTYGAVSYVVSYGPEAEEGGTHVVNGRVRQGEFREKKDLLHERAQSYPAGTVVRFLSHSGVHEPSPHVRPRVFMTGTRWRSSAFKR